MDTFVEQIVGKRKEGKEWAIIIGVSAAFIIVSVLLLMFIPIISFLLIAGAAYGTWWLITSQNIEYEYSVTNGDIDIDQIVARRKRKRIVSVSGAKIESLAPYDAASFGSRPFDRKVLAAPSLREEGLWCFTYHSKKNGNTIVVFQPEQRVLDALIAGLPRLVQIDVNRKLSAAK